ncbi:LysR family transcriptional regulator [Phycicoccus sp. CSK15P-2]|uniref:LysR family transcriptional regulator n=1 Tax=Phycicoccus sp. CSK15P-2 TaxID=2807627 RepID=UPI00195166FC|nr:LysR family transcriptional regulator [Phycicoccus sp. CSK15P-2]MBM6403551.1 LysR family transcriptional regulator [Phycicoccus sp. CSK15P-2]
MTPTQLRAYATVVRLGSLKAAADELGVSEAAVSMHVGQLRKEFDDRLFGRTSSGLAFTPGGLRLASRSVEILGLQDRTVREVTQAGSGRRMLRLAASAMFAEHAAPGLIELFAARAADLDVELSVHRVTEFSALLASRTVDVAIGPTPREVPSGLAHQPFLNYDVVTVAGPRHPFVGHAPSPAQLCGQTWLLGPSAAEHHGVVPGMMRHLGVPEANQRIFQSDAAAVEELQRGAAVGLAVHSAVKACLADQRLVVLEGRGLRGTGKWSAFALPTEQQSPVAAELLRFVTTPRATQAMVRGRGARAGRFRPAVHVTLWS